MLRTVRDRSSYAVSILLLLISAAFPTSSSSLFGQDAFKQELIRERDQLGDEIGRLRADGQVQDAATRVRRMLEIERTVSGPQHPEVASVLDYQTDLLVELDEWSEALDSKTRAVEIWTLAYGPDHWRSVSGRSDLALLQSKSQMTPEQRKRLALAEDGLSFGDEWLRIGLPELAEARLLESKEVIREMLPQSSLPEGECWFHLARLKQRGRDWFEADEAIKNARNIYTQQLGTYHRDIAVILQIEAEIATELQDFNRATTCLHDCMLIRQQSMLPTDHRLRHTFEIWLKTTIDRAWHTIHEVSNSDASDQIRSAIRDSLKVLNADDPLIHYANAHLKEFDLTAAMPKEDRERLQSIRRRSMKVDEPGVIVSAEDQLHRIDELEADRLAIETRLTENSPLWINVMTQTARLADESGQSEPAIGLWTVVAVARHQLYGSHAQTTEATSEVSRLLRSEAKKHFVAGDWEAASMVLETHQRQFDELFGPKDWRNIETKVLQQQLARRKRLSKISAVNFQRAIELHREASQRRRGGKVNEVVSLLRDAMPLVDRGKEDTQYLRAFLLHDLGVAELSAGNFPNAISSLGEALQIWTNLFGSEHPATADSAVELAWCQFRLGNTADAIRLIDTPIAVFRDAGSERTLSLARAYEIRGLCAMQTGPMKAAEDSLTATIEIRRSKLGDDHSDVARSWHNMGVFYYVRGDLKIAKTLFQKAAAVWETHEKFDDFAKCLDFIGQVQLSSGEAPEALLSLERAAEIFAAELNLPPNHPDILTNQEFQADCYAELGNLTRATELSRIVMTASLQDWKSSARQMSTPQRLQSVGKFRHLVDSFVDFSAMDPSLTEERYSSVLSYRGMVLNYEQSIASLARVSTSPEIAAARHQLQSLHPEITSRVFLCASPDDAELNRQELDKLLQQRQDLERTISAGIAVTETASPTSLQVAASLPEKTALVDFFYISRDRQFSGSRGILPRRSLLAFVSGKSLLDSVMAIDLGDAAPIDDAIKKWRSDFGRSQSGHHPAAIQLRQLVWDKLPACLQAAETVVISPEGLLGQFPWCALPGHNADTFLIEDQAIVVTSSALGVSEFLRQPGTQVASGRSLIVGGIEFGRDAAEKLNDAEMAGQKEIMWQPLPGTDHEVNSIAAQLRGLVGEDNVILLTGKNAGAADIRRQMQQSELIHLATHGFYDPPELHQLFASHAVRSGSDADGLRFALSPTETEPELLSGIVFARANELAIGRKVDAVISARELASLDLSNVRLACLSACETGLGELHSSESTLGLCRSLHAAGAQACLASLWRVDDAATATLMSEFYENLLNRRLSKAESLRQAQISLIRGTQRSSRIQRRGATLASDSTEQIVGSPYFWAAFVLSGDWR